jgi:hypothetical protein
MSINELLTRKQFQRLQAQFLASVRVAEENNRNGVVFKNGQGPMDRGRRELVEALLDKNYLNKNYKSKKFKGDRQ